MGIHTLNLADGSQVQVEAPKDATLDELLLLANRQQRFQTPEPTRLRDEDIARRLAAVRDRPISEPEIVEEDDGTAFGRGVSRGIDVTQQQLGSAVEGIGSLLGLEGLEKYGADVALANEAELQRAERNATRLKDVEGVGTGLSYAGELAGESSPMMAGAMAGGAAGAAIGAGFGGVGAIPGSVIGAGLGAAAAMFPLFYGGNRERQKEAIERGERTEMSEGAAALTAIPQSALDAILTGLGAKFFVKPAAEIGGGLLTRAAKGAGAGAVTEIPTEIGQAVLERLQAGLPVADAEAMREYGEAGVAAGLLGGGVGGVAGAVKRPGTPEVDPNALPEGIAGLLPAPTEDELRIPSTRQLQDSTSGEPIPQPAPPKLLTGPDDLGIRLGKPTGTRTELQETRSQGEGGAPLTVVNYTGEPTEATTREQQTAARAEGMKVVERARAELQATGEISSDTMQNLRTARVPFEAVASVLEGTRYEPALALIEGTDLPPGFATKNVAVQPVQNEARLAELARLAKQGGLGGIAAGREMDAQAAEDAQLEQMIGEELTQDVSAKVRKAKATGIEQDIEARAAQDLESRVDQDLADLVTEQEQLRAASAVETAQGKLDTDRIAQTTARRTKVLQDTVANAGEVRRPEALRKLYEDALTKEGIADTKATDAEMESLRRASGAMRAKPPAGITPLREGLERPDTPEIQMEKDPRQVELEKRVAPKPLPKGQDAFADMGSEADLGTPPMRPGQDAFAATPVDTPVEPRIIDAAFFDELAIPASAPIRKRVTGKDFNDPDVRQQFATLAGNKSTSATVKQNINRELAGTPDAQADLPLFGKTRRKPDAKGTDAKPSRVSTTSDKPRSAKGRPSAPSSAEKPSTSDDGAVGRTVSRDGVASDRAKSSSDPLKQKAKPTTKKPTAKPAAKKISNADAVIEAVTEYRKIKTPTPQQSVGFISQLRELGIDNPNAFLLNFKNMKDKLKLPSDLTLEFPVADDVAAAIKDGNLQGALEALAETAPDAKVARIARKLAANVGNTKLVVKKNLKADDSSRVSGYYDPETNTIALDEDTGISTHPLLHEMLHAVTSAVIANKSHPLTKRLNTLFEGVKEQLAGEYGLTTLDEFVAEAMSNPEFQTQLKTTVVDAKNPWQQLVRAVSNFVRRLLGLDTKSDTSTFDAVDEIVQAMIAPTYDGRIATKMYMQIKTPAGAKEAINNLKSSTIKATRGKDFYDYVQAAKEFMGEKTPLTVKKMFLNLQPVNILGEMAKSNIPMATQLNTIINNMSAALRARNESLDPIVGDLRRFKKKFPDRFNTLQSLVPNASSERIDPREADFNKAYGRKKKDERYDEKQAREIHAELRKQYNSLGKEGQDLYKTITNNFEKSMTDVMASIEENLKASIEDAATRKRAFDRLAELLDLQKGTIKPFAPLQREGTFRLAYTTIDPKTGQPEFFVEYYKTQGRREKAKRNLKAYNEAQIAKLPKGDARIAAIKQPWEEGVASTVADFNKAPSDTFVYNVLQTLNAAGVDKEVVDSIAALALDTMPERSFLQSYRVRRDVRGFMGDITPTGMAGDAYNLIDAVQNKGRDYNRQIVQMTYGAKIQKFKNELRSAAPERTTGVQTGLYRDKLLQIAGFAQRPTTPKWSQIATSGGYAWTMGANLSSAAITTFDVFMSTAPRLMGKYGDIEASKALGNATAILFGSPKDRMVEVMGPDGKMTGRKVNTGLAGFSISNYDYDAPNLSPEIRDLGVLAEAAAESAQINQSLNQEQLDMGNAENVMEKINAINSFLFHHAERFNREVAMTATYMLELQRMKNKKDGPLSLAEKKEAAKIAIQETELTLGATASAGRPVFAQSGIGNVAMLFKRFAISKYYMMSRMMDEAFQAGKGAEAKENRRIARNQLGRFLVSTGLFAGVAGLPLMGAVGQIYDLFADEEDDNFDAMLRKTVGEGLYKGIINEALGVEVASRIGMNSLLYRPPIIDKDQSQLWTLLEQLGGPAIGIYLSVERGVGMIGEGEVARGVEAIAPSSIRNVIKGGKQLVTGEVTTRRGDAVIEDIGVGQILAQFGGFANADLIRQYEINKNETRKKDYLRTERTRLLRLANIAAAEGDREGYKAALKKIRQYNKDIPRSAGSKMLIMPDTLRKSRTAFQKRTQKTIGGIEYTPFMRRSLQEYDQGIQMFK